MVKAMLVEINGKRVCVAALNGKGNVNAAIHWWRDDGEVVMLDVVGIDDGEAAIWPAPHLQFGDEVRIKMIDTEKGDPPIKQSTMVVPAKK
jgi:hypothetical protein